MAQMSNNDLKNKGFIGFETFYNNIRMVIKMQSKIFALILLMQITLCVLLFLYLHSKTELSIIFNYLKSYLLFDKDQLAKVFINNQFYEISYNQIRTSYGTKVMIWLLEFVTVMIYTFAIYILFIPLNFFFRKRSEQLGKSKHLKGAKLITVSELNKALKKKNELTYLPFGELKMPVAAEVKHTLIIGRPGVGKTVCMSQILEKIIERGDRCVIHDFKGDYLQKFFRPGIDIIFNPLDERSHYWNFFNEIESPIDVDAIGYALIPDAKGAGMDPFWNNAARDVFTGVVNYCVREGKTTYEELYRIVTAPSTVIADILSETKGSEAGATTIADPESKQTGSIMSVLTQYTKIFNYTKDDNRAEKRFVINEWLENSTGGNIFITNYSTLQDTLAPILTLMIDLMGRKLLSMKDDSTRRIFFLLDEFGTLQKMQTITRLLTLARSKGGGVFIGIQDLGQIDKIYGKEHKQTIVNACGNNVVFSVADNETAESLSKNYGEYISIESYVTTSMGIQDNRDGQSINQTKNKERIILPSEIIDLETLNFYLKFSDFSITKSKLIYKSYPDINEPFLVRKGLTYKEILEDENNAQNSGSGVEYDEIVYVDNSAEQSIDDTKVERTNNVSIASNLAPTKDIDDIFGK